MVAVAVLLAICLNFAVQLSIGLLAFWFEDTYAFHWMDTGTAQLLSDLNQADAADYAFTAWGELLSVLGGTSTPLAWNGEWGYYGDTSARTWVPCPQPRSHTGPRPRTPAANRSSNSRSNGLCASSP